MGDKTDYSNYTRNITLIILYILFKFLQPRLTPHVHKINEIITVDISKTDQLLYRHDAFVKIFRNMDMAGYHIFVANNTLGGLLCIIYGLRLTSFKQQIGSPSWKATGSSGNQQFTHTLWNPKFCYHLYKSLPTSLSSMSILFFHLTLRFP
jgi:hypothetical protein